MMARYRFNEQVKPPAAFVYASVTRPDGGASTRELPAQLDTAADFTVIPAAVVNELKLRQVSEISVAGFGGAVSLVPTYVVDVQVRDLDSKRIEALASEHERYMLLGRDVLNCFRVVLDGPNRVVEIT
jgi:predicted aspartyl protease